MFYTHMHMTKNDKQLLELGKRVGAVIDVAGSSKWQMMSSAFLRGLAQGFGAVVGGTILVALLLWVLSLFNEIPLVGPAFDVVSKTIDKK